MEFYYRYFVVSFLNPNQFIEQLSDNLHIFLSHFVYLKIQFHSYQ